MKRIDRRLTLVLCVLFFSVSLWAADGVLTGDTYTSQQFPANNFKAATSLLIAGSGAASQSASAWMQFDLSTLPVGLNHSNISKATLVIYVNSVPAGGAGVLDAGIPAGAWNEATLTNTSKPSVVAVPGASAQVNQIGYVIFDVTAAVQGWVDNSIPTFGFQVSADNSTPSLSVQIDSKRNTSTSHPAQLWITLTGPAGPQGPAGTQGPVGPQGPAADTTGFALLSASNAFTGANLFTGSQQINGGLTIVEPNHPSLSLDVVGISRVRPFGASDTREINFTTPGSTDGGITMRGNETDLVNRIDIARSGGDILFYTGNQPHPETVRMTASQNVGIGTPSPSERLEVAGNVKANSFIGDGSQLKGITATGIAGISVQPNPTSANIIAGDVADNNVVRGIVGATISGGGRSGQGNSIGTLTSEGDLFGSFATVGGGSGNTVLGNWGSIAGGVNNAATNEGGAVGGGGNNVAGGAYSTVSGGIGNQATFAEGAVGGGLGNKASGQYSTVPGGNSNLAAGTGSFAAGQRAKANNQGAFVWADSQNAELDSTANDQFLIRAAGGVGIGTNSPRSRLTISGAETTLNGFTSAVQISNTAPGGGDWYLRAGATGTRTPAGGFTIADDNGYRFDIDNQGRVGIGTNNPTENLDVIGNVKATTFKGDGSQLTGIVSLNSANTFTGNQLINGGLTTSGNIVASAGTVTASSFVGDGSQLSGLAAKSRLFVNSYLADVSGNGPCGGLCIPQPEIADVFTPDLPVTVTRIQATVKTLNGLGQPGCSPAVLRVTDGTSGQDLIVQNNITGLPVKRTFDSGPLAIKFGSVPINVEVRTGANCVPGGNPAANVNVKVEYRMQETADTNQCAGGSQLCAGAETGSFCIQTASDVSNCGACGNACPSNIANGVSTCSSGACGTMCTSGFGDCDHNSANGCETTINGSDSLNCGSCGRDCSKNILTTAPHVISTGCSAGQCGTACQSSFADCDKNFVNGCEISTATDLNNCGGCGTVCPNVSKGTPTCSNGQCSANCNQGLAFCGAQCTDLQTDVANCGSCGRNCHQGVNIQLNSTCNSGVCGCAAPLSACGDMCRDLVNGSDGFCGSCSTTCAPGIACAQGGCQCPSGQTACRDGVTGPFGFPAELACFNLRSDPNHCGSCGQSCGSGTCSNGVCQCSSGTTLCASGCSDLKSDTNNCGACGHVCGFQEVCNGGTCGSAF